MSRLARIDIRLDVVISAEVNSDTSKYVYMHIEESELCNNNVGKQLEVFGSSRFIDL